MMGVRNLEERRYSVEEYFALLEESQHKLEYHDGTIIELSGAKLNHNRIKEDVSGMLYSFLDDCHPLGSDQAVASPASNSYFFPDLVYVCDEEDKTVDNNGLILLNPSVLIEVLSKSTEGTDRGSKFRSYWRIPNLQEYILIDSRSMRIDIFRRNGQREWTMLSYTQPGDVVPFKALNAELPIDKIYRRVDWTV